MQAVDDKLIHAILKKSRHNLMEYDMVERLLTNRTRKFQIRSRNKQRDGRKTVIVRGTLKGTVVSGDPLDTMMNTPRVIAYLRHYWKRSGCRGRYAGYVSGDDTLQIVEHEDLE